MFGISIESIIQSGGLLVIAAIIFAEGGLLAGFFLPGDTLLLSAGYLSAIGKLPLGWLLVVIVVAGIIGDNTGYMIGKHAGRRLFRRKESLFFHPDQLMRAEALFEKHGRKTVAMARFIPVVRTFAPVVAGASKMPHKRFAIYNAAGVFSWGVGVTMVGFILGHYIGEKVKDIDKYLLLILGVVMLITIGPAIYHLLKAKVQRKRAAKLPASNDIVD